MFEADAKFFQGASDALLRGVLAASQRFTDRTQIALLKEAQQDCGAVLCSKLVDRFIEDGRNLRQIHFGVVLLGVHLYNLPFTGLPTALAPHDFGGHEASVAM